MGVTIHDVVQKGDVDALRTLLAPLKDAPPRQTNGADDLGDPTAALLKALQARGPDIEKRDRFGCTPFHVGLLHGRMECLRVLREYGADVNARVHGSGPLHMLLSLWPHRREFSRQALQYVLTAVGDLKQVDYRGRTALHALVAAGSLQCWPDIPVAPGSPDGIPVNAADNIGRTALHEAVIHRQHEAVGWLLGRGADPSLSDSRGCTAFHLAQQVGDVEVARLLVATPQAEGESDCVSHDGVSLPTAIAALRTLTSDGGAAGRLPTLFYRPQHCLQHITSEHTDRTHALPPENPLRLKAIYTAFASPEFSPLEVIDDSPPVSLADLVRVHDSAYVYKVAAVCKGAATTQELSTLDPDTTVSGGSWKAALAACGSVIRAVDRVMSGEAANAFCAVRPPGHHAGPSGIGLGEDDCGSHGFCLFNNVAVGAAYARYRHGSRVAIVDFDVHHGNGTEAIVRNIVPREITQTATLGLPFGPVTVRQHSHKPWLDHTDGDHVFFASLHGFGGGFYPGTGRTVTEGSGRGAADVSSTTVAPGVASSPIPTAGEAPHPKVINIGLGRHCSAEWRAAVQGQVLPELVAFAPDLILLSAGFDAHKRDSINGGFIALGEEDYAWITLQLRKVANTCCKGRLVSVLEGGYAIGGGGVLSMFARSVAAHVRGLMHGMDLGWDAAIEKSELVRMEDARRQAIEEARKRAREAEDADDDDDEEPSPKRRLDWAALAANLPVGDSSDDSDFQDGGDEEDGEEDVEVDVEEDDGPADPPQGQ